jgi:hypothetical protein
VEGKERTWKEEEKDSKVENSKEKVKKRGKIILKLVKDIK